MGREISMVTTALLVSVLSCGGAQAPQPGGEQPDALGFYVIPEAALTGEGCSQEREDSAGKINELSQELAMMEPTRVVEIRVRMKLDLIPEGSPPLPEGRPSPERDAIIADWIEAMTENQRCAIVHLLEAGGTYNHSIVLGNHLYAEGPAALMLELAARSDVAYVYDSSQDGTTSIY